MYKFLIRPLLFRFNPEFAHNLTLRSLRICSKIPFFRALIRMRCREKHSDPTEVFGLKFRGKIGLSAGLDKNGDYFDLLEDFGFSFIEIGSVTPNPQPGNPKPRSFRLPADNALINRMGINNKGAAYMAQRLSEHKKDVHVPIAISLAHNTSSDPDQAIRDYEDAFCRLYDFADMIVINLSCPNVEGLASLQNIDGFSRVMTPLLDRRPSMDSYKPILVKVSPDLEYERLDVILDYCMTYGVDGVIAGNTSNSRSGLSTPESTLERIGKGGLSGAPLLAGSTAMVRHIRTYTKGRLPVIGCGGIMSKDDVQAMLDAGASLVQIYTAFIYEGPSAVRKFQNS